MSPAERVKRILDEAVGRDLSSWERYEFLVSVRNQTRLSDKQEKIIVGIERRLFKDESK